MIKRQESKVGFARHAVRLCADTSGNAMMIMAIAIIPIIGIVGSAFDMGRAYMVKTRLQQACDAGALAGRRAMTTALLDADSEAQARAFFKNNYPDGAFGTGIPTFAPSATDDGQVEAEASVTVPMTLMRLFKISSLPITVQCEAILEVANTDIMFVLDVTGSMNCLASDTDATCTDNGLSEKTLARIKALRTAVVGFYSTLNSAISKDARLRIGFMPYSTTVNVGADISSYLASTWKYQSRERVDIGGAPTVGSWPSSSATTPSWSAYSSWITESNNIVANSNACVTPTPNPAYSYGTVTTGTPSNSTDSSTGAVTTTTTSSRTATETSYQKTYTSGTKNCKIEQLTRTRTETKSDVKVTSYTWYYKQWEPPAALFADYKAGLEVTTMTGNAAKANSPATSEKSKWAGCIEEADTLSNATFSDLPVDGAFDLDIDLIPSDTEEKWRPSWPQIIFQRATSGTARPDVGPKISTSNNTRPTGNDAACPKRAQKLKIMTKAEVEAYVNEGVSITDFKAVGYTYHDTGMLWGARYISPDGIFKDENREVLSPQKGAGKPINRHIIFMSDGDMKPNATSYGLYGMEQLDGRVGNGTTSDLKARHNSRFLAICSAAKAKNITIWVVAYAQTMTTQLSSCANTGKAFYASSDEELKEKFKTIANKIADLRLSR